MENYPHYQLWTSGISEVNELMHAANVALAMWRAMNIFSAVCALPDIYQVGFGFAADKTSISIDAKETGQFNPNSIFKTLETVSDFFEKGAVGYSPNGDKYEGLKLQSYTWQVRPLEVSAVHSSFYENEEVFPKGTVQFDNALLMTNVEHEWKSLKDKPHAGTVHWKK